MVKGSSCYKPPVRALDNINITIAPGTKVGIVGRTGSGKSFFLLSLLRLIELGDQAVVRLDGSDICGLPRDTVHARTITIPQNPMLITTDTVPQNLDIAAASLSEDDVVGVLDRVGLLNVLKTRASASGAAYN